jgi:hypothetical protein
MTAPGGDGRIQAASAWRISAGQRAVKLRGSCAYLIGGTSSSHPSPSDPGQAGFLVRPLILPAFERLGQLVPWSSLVAGDRGRLGAVTVGDEGEASSSPTDDPR